MLNRPLVVAVVAAGCIAAAGLGGFLAVRFNSAAPSAAALPQASTETVVTPASAPSPVAAEQVISRTTPSSLPPVEAGPSTPPAPSSAPSTRASAERGHAAASNAPARPSAPVPQPAEPAATNTPSAPPAASVQAAPAPVEAPESVPATPVVAPEPPRPTYEELRVKSESVIGIRLDTSLTSRTAHVEDRVSARVSRDVFVDGRVAIPAGARLEGTVTVVEQGDKFRNRARLGVKFNSIVLADKTRLPIDTETIFRDGESPTGEATAKIGASAVVGAILGAVVGGKKGAAIGGAAGAGGGTAAVMAGGVNDAVLESGTPLTVRLNAPVTVLVEKQQNHDGE